MLVLRKNREQKKKKIHKRLVQKKPSENNSGKKEIFTNDEKIPSTEDSNRNDVIITDSGH